MLGLEATTERAMRALDIIAKKRDGQQALSAEEIDFFVQGLTRGEIPDYQVAAWLMAVTLRGMNREETTRLTLAMAHSGRVLDLSSVAPVVVDKHSTGGVGDKTTLAVAPWVAATGLAVGKMSGRGLGFTGGSIDKLESFPGYRSDLSEKEFVDILARHGIVVAGQSPDLAPADGILYALRDVTATVECLPLIASSIMSKKLAAGADAIVLDVKVGRGAFMKTEEEALALAQTMIEIGSGTGKRVAAVISDMNQPLGRAVGNALEVEESILTLKGQGPPDFLEHCSAVAAQMLLLAERASDEAEAHSILNQALGSGRALAKMGEWIAAQGGDSSLVDDPSRLPRAPVQHDVLAPQEGYIAALDALEVGIIAMQLGAGRAKKGDPIDHGVGIVLHRKVGERTAAGEPLATIHARTQKAGLQAEARLGGAYRFSPDPVPAPPLIHRVLPWQRP